MKTAVAFFSCGKIIYRELYKSNITDKINIKNKNKIMKLVL